MAPAPAGQLMDAATLDGRRTAAMRPSAWPGISTVVPAPIAIAELLQGDLSRHSPSMALHLGVTS